MILNALKDRIPPLPGYKAKYRVIYFEPITGSGERYTIGVIAKSSDEIKVLQTINHQTLRCMFGSTTYPKVKNLINLILNDAKAHLENGFGIEEWKAPFSGVYVQETRTTYSSNKMEGILFQAISSYSSLHKGPLVDEPIQEFTNLISPEDDFQTARLITSIKNMMRKEYAKNFHKKYSLDRGMNVTLDYSGKVFNAELSNFLVRNPFNALKSAKVKLLELESYRDSVSPQRSLIEQKKFEILISHEEIIGDETEEAIQQVEAFARSREIITTRWTAINKLANHIQTSDSL